MAPVRRFDMRNKNVILALLVLIFISCGGGGGDVFNLANSISSITNGGSMVMGLIPVGL